MRNIRTNFDPSDKLLLLLICYRYGVFTR